ncbi:MAG TPA: prolyl oligopeptidase family serine peptidase [Bacillota bacterium]|nr:prolyl oligopeptidase family serine peptidase [Bacillota bacterium]
MFITLTPNRPVRILILLCAILAAWSGRPAGAEAPSRDEVEAFYSYDSEAPLAAAQVLLGSSPWYREYEVRYSSLGEIVYARFMVPRSTETMPIAALGSASGSASSAVPCLVGLHGMFSDSEYQFWSIADFCAKRGIAVMTPSLPYHHKRTEGVPLIPGQQLIIGPPDAVRENLRRAVVDARRAVDWLAARPDIDQSAISIAGVSLGGIVASLAFKVEPRFANGVFVVGGSGVGGILEHGRTDVLDIFRAAAKANVVNPQDFIDALQIADPINIPDLVPRPALLMNGVSDIIMVMDNALRFRESMSLAEQIWTTGGHYFPMYAAEYLLMDYIAEQYAASPAFSRGVRIQVGSGFSFTERVRPPKAGADNLWVDVRAELGTPGLVADHQLSVPMVNRAVPIVVMSRETYASLAPFLLGRHLPAFIYIINHDDSLELSAALAYAQVLGLRADPQVYYIGRVATAASGESRDSRKESQWGEGGQGGYGGCGGNGGQESCFVGALSLMQVGYARSVLESIVRVPHALARPESVPVPLSIFANTQSLGGPGAEEAVGSWLAQATAVSRLKPIPWFPDYPHDNPRWATENPRDGER